LYLCLHQDVQDECRNEIKHVLGASERCKMSHLTSLPYTLATITEIQRVARVAPSSLLHKTSSPTTIEGYNFPAKSVFAANLSHITHDPSIIKDPHYFNPQRWIGQDGRFLKNDRLIPFGIGKRVCMGELLARNEIFLFTVNLIQSIKFLPPVQNPIPSPSNYIVNLSRIPDDFYIRFEAT